MVKYYTHHWLTVTTPLFNKKFVRQYLRVGDRVGACTLRFASESVCACLSIPVIAQTLHQANFLRLQFVSVTISFQFPSLYFDLIPGQCSRPSLNGSPSSVLDQPPSCLVTETHIPALAESSPEERKSPQNLSLFYLFI